VKQSIYFHRKPDSITDGDSVISDANNSPNFTDRLKRAYRMLWADFTKAYSNPYIVKWSVWWAISSAGFLQTISYIQPLWEEIAAYKDNEIYNGAVDAVHTILSALLAILVGHITIPWRKWGESLLCIISLLQGALLIWMSQTETLMIAYVGYIIFRTLYQVMITVASYEVANNITADSSGLIFGINRFFALSFQSLLTFAVADEGGFALGERNQFIVYGAYFLVLGGIFAIVVSVTVMKYFCKATSFSEIEINGGIQNESISRNNSITRI
ncbi:Thiamine transporter 2, partial [Orchesella cincta]